MNSVILFLTATVLGLVLGEQYTDRYDNIDIDEVLANRRLLVPYIKCTLDEGRCTPEGKALKLHVKDAMQTSCEKCTPYQRRGARRVVKHVREHESEYWEALKKKYDPDSSLAPVYEAFLAANDEE